MKQMIRCVTITGADDSINPKELFKLSDEFPFVEWGILFSKSAEGKYRYPTRKWLWELYTEWCRSYIPRLNFSAHICGRWVRDICAGSWTIFEDHTTFDMFKRIQLNFHALVHELDEQKFIAGFKDGTIQRQYIFQLDNVNNGILNVALNNNVDAVPLFDLSGGAGILPEEWPRANGYCGYAGGLSPENLESQLELIEQVADYPMWIDTETRVRSDGDYQFDLGKVRAFLEVAKPWVKS